MSDATPSKLHIAFASAEAAPFVKTGGLGDVAGSLPHALKAAGADVVVFVPKYDTIAQEYKDRMEHLCDFYVPLGWRNEYCGLERLNHEGVDYLFVDNERYSAAATHTASLTTESALPTSPRRSSRHCNTFRTHSTTSPATRAALQ